MFVSLVCCAAAVLLLAAETRCFHGIRTRKSAFGSVSPSSTWLRAEGEATVASAGAAVVSGDAAVKPSTIPKASGPKVYTPRNDKAVTNVDGGECYVLRSLPFSRWLGYA